MGLKEAIIVFIIGNLGLWYFTTIIPEQMYRVTLAVPIMVIALESLILGVCRALLKER